MKKWVIFDVMGVVFTVGDDTNDLLVPFIQKRNKFITSDEINEIYLDASMGSITSNEFWRKVNICKPGEEFQICREYLDTCLSIDENFIPIAKQLKKKYHLALLSNDVSEWSIFLRKKFNIDDVVDFSIISGDVKCRKPDILIYQKAIQRMKADPSDCVFIDDRDKNLVPAINQGMNAIRFLREDINTKLDGVLTISNFLELEDRLQDIWSN